MLPLNSTSVHVNYLVYVLAGFHQDPAAGVVCAATSRCTERRRGGVWLRETSLLTATDGSIFTQTRGNLAMW